MKSHTWDTVHFRGLFLTIVGEMRGGVGSGSGGGGGVLRLLPLVSGATLSLSGLDFFSGGSPVGFTLPVCSLVLLFEPGGRPGPRLVGAVVFGGADLSSFSDFLLTGADKLEASMSLSSIFSRSLIVLLMPFALRFFVGLTGNGCEDSLII